jgi:hypothetical protein
VSTPSGALWEPGQHDGLHKGSESVDVSAQDTGGGVKSIVLAVDGQPEATYSAACDHTYPQPCPTSTGPQTLTLPTAEFSDGAHTLALTATDAAGNQASTSEQITIENNPPPPPRNLTATPTPVDGSTFLLSWEDPEGQLAAITAATLQVCPAAGARECGAPTPEPVAGPATVTVPGPGTWSIPVWLTNAAGNSSTTNAASTIVTVPPASPNNTSPDNSSPGGPGPDSDSYGINGTPPPPPRMKVLHLSEELRGRELIIRLRQLTATFKLSRRAATQATIRVKAELNHGPTVTSTLRRPTTRRRKSP